MLPSGFATWHVLQDECTGGSSPSQSVVVMPRTLPTVFRSFFKAHAILCTAMLCIAFYAFPAYGIFVCMYSALTFPYLTFQNSANSTFCLLSHFENAFCSQNVFIDLIRFSDETITIPLNNMNQVIFVPETHCVFCDVETGFITCCLDEFGVLRI